MMLSEKETLIKAKIEDTFYKNRGAFERRRKCLSEFTGYAFTDAEWVMVLKMYSDIEEEYLSKIPLVFIIADMYGGKK